MPQLASLGGPGGIFYEPWQGHITNGRPVWILHWENGEGNPGLDPPQYGNVVLPALNRT